MPELPDVTVYREAMERHVVGQPLERVRLVSLFVLRSVDPPLDAFEGQVVRGVRRIGKRIVLVFDGEMFLVIHLKQFRFGPGIAEGYRTVVDGRGMTLSPGLWDCHMHVGDDYTGLQELSMGVTSLRDPGNNDALTIDRRTRPTCPTMLAMIRISWLRMEPPVNCPLSA